jgi:hypothetical protein
MYEFGRTPPFIACHVKPDEFSYRGGVLVQAVEFIGVFGWNRAAVAGANRIDKDQIALVDQ